MSNLLPEPDDATVAGQAVYTPRLLGWYDLLVLSVSNRWIWRCPTPRLLDWYNQHVSARHLDVGVGTGYFLDHCQFPSPSPQITLVDLNEHCLAAASGRIRRYQPRTTRADVLQPFRLETAPFDSIGLNYLLHCVPGNLASKSRVFDHGAEHLSADGVLFGSTLLSEGVRHTWTAQCLAAYYNRRRIFSNTDDRLDDLRSELGRRFERVRIEVVGSVALFAASARRVNQGKGSP